jgi:acetyl esterase/lipase
MALDIDPEVAAALAPLIEIIGDEPPPPVGDVATRRANTELRFAPLMAALPAVDDVDVTSFEAPSADGEMLALRLFTKRGSRPGSAALYIHGGGMIFGSVAMYEPVIARYASASGVPLLAVDYRLAPEYPHPTPVEDCYAALQWLNAHAGELIVDPARIGVMGDSAGGGLTAAVALLARERGGPPVARQILIYPMLDDRTTVPDPHIEPWAIWTYDDNITGWSALLGDVAGGTDVPSTAAPARATDLAGLPPAYLDVGTLDVFLQEDVDYAARLARAGVPIELHVHPGGPHGFEVVAPDSGIGSRAFADRVRALQSL